MKILVVSDNHGNKEVLESIVEKYENEAILIHCGDSELPQDDPIWKKFTAVVKGNCDFDQRYPNEALVKIGEERIYVTHGHLADVRFGLETLMKKTAEVNATLCFFGHTHMIGCEKRQGTLFLNPGSISQPRGTLLYKSYAVIEVNEETYDVKYYTKDHEIINKLQFSFQR